MEVDGVRTRMGSNVVHPTQEVIGAQVHLVCRASHRFRLWKRCQSDALRVGATRRWAPS
jgi:hypothetical protein